jgi:hypothetical protein
MAVQVQHRRGTATANASFIGAVGELIWLTDEKRWVGHDGSTVGGVKMARFDEISEDTYREVGNANVTVQLTDGRIAVNASLTAARTVALPAADDVPAGKTYRISDKAGGINGSNILNLTRSGSDTINGDVGPVALSAARGAWEITSDGVSNWSVVSVISDGDKGDVTVSGAGAAWTVDAGAITDTKLRNSGALSVIGRAANSTGVPADIAAGTDGHVLRRSGASLGFGQLAAGAFANNTVPVAAINNSELTVFARTLLDDTDAAAARGTLSVPALPQTGAGAGQFVTISANNSYSVPAGGTWAYAFIVISSSTNLPQSCFSGVVSGGSSVFTGSGQAAFGWALRIA